MDIDTFLDRWLDLPGGAERSNSQPFLVDLCRLLDVAPPRPAAAGARDNDYVFERHVRMWVGEGEGHYGRIDLYKRDAFVLEAKQSHLPEGVDAPEGRRPTAPAPPVRRGRRSIALGWDRLMRNALQQAQGYVHHLPPDHAAPPFLIVCDVGHTFEVYADFSGTGRSYSYFPDRQGYRIYLEDLRSPEIRTRLATIWTAPTSLDPARRKAQATRSIASRLAVVSKGLEREGKAPDRVALFLMRCIFTMFACSVGLLPENGLTDMIQDCLANTEKRFSLLLKELWRQMNEPDSRHRFFSGFGNYVPYFGGELFREADVYDLSRDAILTLLDASRCSWSDVEPAIFGALLEDALKPDERRRLGAHYTPRPHVERLVSATITRPLRKDWQDVLTRVERLRDLEDFKGAQGVVRDFRSKLTRIRVLDPACGTGNFLYIALEAMKNLEAEVVETLVQLGVPETLGLEGVDPRQFLGLELNARAVAIAKLVLWIGFLQLHYRTHSGHPSEPILRASSSIEHRDAVLTWTGYPDTHSAAAFRGGAEAYPQPRRPRWPEAEFIVGNPPFMGGKDLRKRLGDERTQALWAAHPHMNRSADLVMYWWDHAAELLTLEGSVLRRFGFVTTNSIAQAFQRQTVERRLTAAKPVHLTYAAPDQPWTVATPRTAAVRVAMTVAAAGYGEGERLELVGEAAVDSDVPDLDFRTERGRINADLTVGLDLARAEPLRANHGLCSPGVKLHGSGFIVSLDQARRLGLGHRAGLEAYIHPYCNGRDVVQHARNAWVIDLYPLEAETVRARFPEVYQHLLATVKPHRDANRMAFRREHWWWFGATHETYRRFTAGLDRYIATPETAKHRIFVFLPAGARADNMLVSFGLNDAFHLGVLSSRPHLAWALANGAVLEDRPRYTKSACFDPFPFPDPVPALRAAIAQTAEALHGVRIALKTEHPDLTLTLLYNGLAALRENRPVDADMRDRGQLLILRELHACLDEQVAKAYGWPPGLADHEMLTRMAALNHSRRLEEQVGEVRWLRPDHQTRLYPQGKSAMRLAPASPKRRPPVAARAPLFPRDRGEQSLAVLQMLESAAGPVDAVHLVKQFRNRPLGQAQRIADILVTLADYGRVSVMSDGRYLARKAA